MAGFLVGSNTKGFGCMLLWVSLINQWQLDSIEYTVKEGGEDVM